MRDAPLCAMRVGNFRLTLVYYGLKLNGAGLVAKYEKRKIRKRHVVLNCNIDRGKKG